MKYEIFGGKYFLHMGLQDLFITPVYIILLLGTAYIVAPSVTNKQNRFYFFTGLIAHFFGALALGMIYQFYYGGGDTFNYFNQSRWIFNAFYDEPIIGLKLLFADGVSHIPEAYNYSQHIWFYGDPHSYMIVRIAGFFDLFTFHTYSSTALWFALFSFSGLWAMYMAVSSMYPHKSRRLALAILFIPSVVFWGSGILKDSITIGALGYLTYACIYLIHFKQRSIKNWIIGLLALILIFSIKVYIVICFVPMLFVWFYLLGMRGVKSKPIKIMVAPILLVLFAVAGYVALNQIASESDRYALDQIAERAAINAYDIRYGWGARTGGDGGYDLGNLDGTWGSMIRLMPQAVNVSLFRPYLWEAKNPVMILAAFESLFTLVFTLIVIFSRGGISRITKDPFLVFCVLFSLVFAFAVGISTFNFGTLMRYKIPILPFYFLALVVAKK